jgi:hypothetical protein
VTDVVVTVPMAQWALWIDEGDLPGDEPTGARSHFWLGTLPEDVRPGDRVYVVAHRRLRGYAPLVGVEYACRLDDRRSCLMRDGGAVAVTIDEWVRGFRGFRYRWWDRGEERPFPEWRIP